MPRRVLEWKTEVVVPVILEVLEKILGGLGPYLWQEFQGKLFELVAYAQIHFERGLEKREYVVDALLDLVRQAGGLGTVAAWLLRIPIGLLVDATVQMLKGALGDDWEETVREYFDAVE